MAGAADARRADGDEHRAGPAALRRQRRVAEHDQRQRRGRRCGLGIEARHPQQRIDGAVGQQSRRAEAQRFMFQSARTGTRTHRQARQPGEHLVRRGRAIAAADPQGGRTGLSIQVAHRRVNRLDDQGALCRQPGRRTHQHGVARRVQALGQRAQCRRCSRQGPLRNERTKQ
jgi:hypothetical protein